MREGSGGRGSEGGKEGRTGGRESGCTRKASGHHSLLGAKQFLKPCGREGATGLRRQCVWRCSRSRILEKRYGCAIAVCGVYGQVYRGDADAVQKLYEVLLASPSSAGLGNGELGRDLRAPELHERLLQSLTTLVRGRADALRERAAPAAGGLAFRGAIRREVASSPLPTAFG